MIRAAAVVVALVAVLALGVPASSAADECKGLMVCIPVAGPWVVIPPAGAGVAAVTANWQLVCPEGVVGGVDARVSEPAVAVEFPGRIGSPVNPGITTNRTLVFKGTYAGRERRPTTFRPFIGCIPGSGGGSRTPTAFMRVSEVKPGEPITTRAKTLRVTPGKLARATLTCRPGERLLSSSHSVGIYAEDEPTAAQLAAVRVVRARRGRTILVSATRRGLGAALRVEVQVLAECAR